MICSATYRDAVTLEHDLREEVANFDPRFEPSRVPPIAWACLAAVIVLCTVIPYLLNSWALARTHASRVAFYVFLQPLIATALAIPILGEALSFKTVVAGLLIFAGLAVTVLSRQPQPTADETLSV